MEKELNIGILDLTSVWRTLLNQIGVSYTEIPAGENISLYRYTLIIVNRYVTNKEFDRIKEYIREGGAIIDEGYCVGSIVNGTITREKCSYIIPEKHPFKPHPGIIDIYSSVSIFSKAQYLDKTLYVDSYGEGIISFLGLNIDTLLADTRTKRKEFYTSSNRFPNEEVSYVSKGEIIRLIFCLMRYLHISRGFPFAHKWFFPKETKNIFMFRIDSDYGKKQQIKRWYDTAQSNNIRYTWFLHVAAHEGWINMFSDFKGHEIAVHGYNHFTSKYYIDNRENIEKALRILSKNGINCSGYASPYGLWNKSLNDVCENLGFKYSSEFSYIYDALPLNPVINNRISPVLQIPIHPICLGSLVNAKLNENNIIEYFRNQFQWKITHCNPLIFYDHVLHNRSDLLEEIFRGVNSLDVSVLTFSEYVNWWKKRENIEYTLVKKPDNFLRIECSEPKSECFLCIWISNDTYILTNNSSIINQTTYRTNTINYNVEEDIGNLKKIRKFNFNLYKLSILNKLIWRKTG